MSSSEPFARCRAARFPLVVACALSITPATACETGNGNSQSSPLTTRKPLQSEDVRLTTGFGMRRDPVTKAMRLHPGIDWSARPGTLVVAVGGGRVIVATFMERYGQAVLVDHGAGIQTLYGHLGKLMIQQGDCIGAGAVLGEVGAQGEFGGPTLHFEVRVNGQPTDPLLVLTGDR